MIKAADIRASIGEFLEGKRTFDDFENWIVRNTWNIHQWGDIEAQMLAYDIELRLSEHSVGTLPLNELRSELQNLANSFVLQMGTTYFVTASSTMLSPQPWPVQPADRPLATASESPVPH